MVSIHVGGYARVPVDLGGLARQDVRLRVAEGPAFAAVSASADAGADPAEAMLLAGPHPGTYTLEVRDLGGGLVSSTAFAVTEDPPPHDGPPTAFTGANPMYPRSGAWGSVLNPMWPAGFTYGPSPVSGPRRVAIVYVGTRDSASAPATPATYRTALETTRDYFREISHGALEIVPAGEATVRLPRRWNRYHEPFGPADGRQAATHELIGEAMRRAQADLDLGGVDTCVFVVAPPGRGRFSWPIASGGTYQLPLGPLGWSWKSLPWVVMPANWEAVGTRRAFQTLTHEIGHTIGLGDMYGADPRDIGGWDVMSDEARYSGLSLPHRVVLGWTDRAWLRRYDFTREHPVDEEVVLTAAGLTGGGPPPGERAGLEVEVADGWRYYFEYRSRQHPDGADPGPAQLADQNLPADRVVLGTDVVAGWYRPPVVRRPIRLLADDGDGEGAALPAGADYEESDGDASFRVHVLAADDDRARVRVTYRPTPGVVPRPDGPDPSIRPWPGGGDWRSPDVTISNATGLPFPWAGHDNVIVATVRNRGAVDATGVKVGFWVKDFSVSATGPETFLGWDRGDVPAGGERAFRMDWRPPAARSGLWFLPLTFAHYCVVVRIEPVPGERSTADNEAQTNFTLVWTAAASPYDRQAVPVTVSNPYPDRPVRVNLHAEQTLDGFRTYLEHTWVRLAPGETRAVEVMVECVAREPAFADRVREAELWRTPNVVTVVATVADPGSDVLTPIGGGTIEVRAGLATGLTELDVSETSASGRLTTAEGDPVAGATVLLTSRDAGRAELVERATTDVSGRFSTLVRRRPAEIAYPGDLMGYAPCSAKLSPV
ncbi:hypothetical protein [Herbidospora daliensis]|uniref:hypothetical protein n=1 Tax=Herbidospora daliensis TaxID=295585 RepID=UPI0007810D3F|nr:hypothetical protein [Herbidospora daliensis]